MNLNNYTIKAQERVKRKDYMAGCDSYEGVVCQVGDLLYPNFEMPLGTYRRTLGKG